MTVRLLLFVLILSALGAAPVRAAALPDIVVVMVDDLGAIDERILERLPNIKSLFLDVGLRFDAYYSETPLCCPGRASFLTGQHTRRHGVTRNDARLLDPSHTVFTALHEVGYQTALIGKYLNNAEMLSDPTPPGYDHVAFQVALGLTATDPTIYRVDGRDVNGGYVDRFTLDDSLRWVTSLDPSRPFALWANPKAPHFAPTSKRKLWVPLIEPRYVGDSRCAGIPKWKPPAYGYMKQPDGYPLDLVCESLLTTDEMVGALRAEMERQGRTPTWVFTSDNGMAWGWKGFPAKNVPEAARVPLYISGPGIAHGSTTALLSNIDLGPTLAALGGTSMPLADGDSFLALLFGGTAGRAWMLEDHPLGGNTHTGFSGKFWGIRTTQWHLVGRKYSNGWFYALYHLTVDPWEQFDVRKSNRDEFRRLKALFPY